MVFLLEDVTARVGGATLPLSSEARRVTGMTTTRSKVFEEWLVVGA
jgi:hypothetical protein